MPASKQKRNQQAEFAKNAILFLSGIVIGILVILVMYPNRITTSSSSKEGNNEINNTFSSGDSRIDDYFAFKINAPKDYFATTDQMLTSYLTMGGMAPPRLVLSKNSQLLGDDSGNYLNKVWNYNSNDCMSIWTTGGLSSIEEWLDLPSLEIGELSNKESIKSGSRNIDIYKLKVKSGNVYVAFMPIKNDFSTSYFFRTCNENNKEDLVNVIKSLKLRIDGGI